ncbi:MAG: excisionase family DNA-binding protein [Terriglobia bacterium]|jgi:excisionase family DNA binding protein
MRHYRIEVHERAEVEALLEPIDQKLERLLRIAESSSQPKPPMQPHNRLEVLNGRLTLGVKECAKALGVSRDTLRRRIGDGKLRFVRVGGRVLLQTDEWKSFLEGKK